MNQADVPEAFSRAYPDMPTPITRALSGRGFTSPEAVEAYLSPSYSRDLHDPMLFADMERVVHRIAQAIDRQERIAIHGDYDADGVTASAILSSVLIALGCPPRVFLPHRELDGYGVSVATVQRLVQEGASVLITVDCGISCLDAIREARELGMDVIVVDHHEPKETLPDALGIIHPIVDKGYPDKTLTGGAVALKLLQALVRSDHPLIRSKREAYAKTRSPDFSWEGFEKWMLDLAAISTVADCASLTGESRILVYWGLEVLKKTRRMGLRMLLSGRDPSTIDARAIGFIVAPRLNAAGRMDHPRLAYDLLMADDEESARAAFERIELLNRERQEETHRVFTSAMEQVLRDGEGSSAVVAFDPQWSLGVVGIVASRLSDRFQRPAFVLTRSNGKFVGSARSPKGTSALELLESAHEYLERFGGHSQAAGFTIEKEEDIALFRRRLSAIAAAPAPEQALAIDAQVPFSQLNSNLFGWVRRCEPHGVGNPPLSFLSSDCVIGSVRRFKDGKHLELMLRRDGIIRRFVGFGQGERAVEFHPGRVMDIVYELKEKSWNGKRCEDCYFIDGKEV